MVENNICDTESLVLESLLEEEYIDLPLDVLHFDSNQPRKDLGNIQELALSIKTQGLQQPITVNRWKIINGIMHYIVFKGARRFKSHLELVNTLHLSAFRTIKVIVAKEAYDGKLNLARKLSQWAENSGHKDQSKKETLEFLKELISEEEEGRRSKGLEGRGAISLAVKRLCDASGKSKAWGDQYAVLCKLIPSLVDLLDQVDRERLNFAVALQLSRLPPEIQFAEYQKSIEVEGAQVQAKYIQDQVKAMHTKNGKKVVGHPVNDKKRFLSLSKKIRKLLYLLKGQKNEQEYQAFVATTFRTMTCGDLSQILALLKENTEHLLALRKVVEEVWKENAIGQREDKKVEIKKWEPPQPLAVKPIITKTIPDDSKDKNNSVWEIKGGRERKEPSRPNPPRTEYTSRIVKGNRY